MTRHRTVLLRHECGELSHYDWMIEDPTRPPDEGSLWTWRIAEPSWRWRELRTLAMEALDAHRRDYLTYEGELSGSRGVVRRVDEGTVEARAWSGDRALLDVELGRFAGVVELRRVEGKRWAAFVNPRA